MQVISEYFEEYRKRWNKIGQVCGFHVSSPVAKSPDSQSSREFKSTVTRHGSISHVTHAQRSFLEHDHRLSELVHPSPSPYHHSIFSSTASLTTQTDASRFPHTLPRGKSLSLPRATTSGALYTLEKKHQTIPAIPQFPALKDPSTDNKTLTDSISSLSSSCSSALQLATVSSVGHQAGSEREEVDDLLQRSFSSPDGDDKRGSREGSVDGMGRGGARVWEKAFGSRPRTDSLDAEEGKTDYSSSFKKVHSSPQALDHIRSRGHGKRATLTSDV